MAEPEAPQRDRWEEAAKVVMRQVAGTDAWHPYSIARIQDAMCAAYQQGQKDEREACAMLAESVLGDAAFLSSPCDHGTPCQYCLPDAIRSRAQEEPKR